MLVFSVILDMYEVHCYLVCHFFASFSVARVSHDETKLNRVRRKSITGGIQGNGDGGGVAVVGIRG